jgi:hypothetical protein
MLDGHPVLISKQNFVFASFQHVPIRDTDSVATVGETYLQMENYPILLNQCFGSGSIYSGSGSRPLVNPDTDLGFW